MTQRVTYRSNEKRRDQRRPIARKGTLNGIEVILTDLSFQGIGGRAVEPRELVVVEHQLKSAATRSKVQEASQNAERQEAHTAEAENPTVTLEMIGFDHQPISFQVTLHRADTYTGGFGATFVALDNKLYDAIEQLMFPQRGAAKS